MDMTLKGIVRRFAMHDLGGASKELRLTGNESLAVAQVEPEGFEIGRAGRRFYGGAQNGATGRAPVAAIPTTAAAFVLWNAEPQGGANYVLEQIAIAQLSGIAAVGGAILFALTNRVALTNGLPAAATGYSSASLSGGKLSSRTIWADNQTLSATPVWGVLSANGNPASTTNGGDVIDVKGRIIVPPQYGLALHYLSGAGTSPLFLASAIWDEIDGELE